MKSCKSAVNLKDQTTNSHKILMAVVIMITTCLSGCSYGDDIDSLKDRVSDLESIMKELKEAYDSGKIITSITPIDDNITGYLVSFSDGFSVTLRKGKEGCTPIVKIDNDGYWTASFDNGQSFNRISDVNGELVNSDYNLSVIIDGKNGNFVFQITGQEHPENIIDVVEADYYPDPECIIQSVVENQKDGIVTITLSDGSKYEFNLEVVYPTGIVLLTDHLDLKGNNHISSFEFRINPSNSFINFIYEGADANIHLDRVSKTRAGDASSYITVPTNYHIIDVAPSVNDNGERKVGQYTVTVEADGKDADGEEMVSLVITTKDRKGNRIQLSSNIMTLVYDTRPQIYGINIDGIEANKINDNTFYIQLPYNADLSNLSAAFSTNSTISIENISKPQTLNLSTPLTITATLNEVSRDYTLIAHFSNLPVFYITTSAPVVSKEDWIKNNTIQIANAGEYDNLLEKVQIKGRGNSTWEYPKKPYALKLDKKIDILGMPKHKRWCLLANWMDPTDMRNEIAFEIGRRMTGLNWTPKGRFIDVVYNGKYTGNYYLCEQIKIDSNRVNIDEMTDKDTSAEVLTGGYLLELDTHYYEVNKFRTSILNLPVNLKDPDEDVLQPSQLEYIKNYFNNVEIQLYNHANYSIISSLLDIDSFIDWWLLHELTYNGEPAHPKSSYMYKPRNGKLCAGPVWDFDWGTFSDASNWINKHALWYGYLFQYPEFIERVKERWQINRDALRLIPNYIESLRTQISASVINDCHIWPVDDTISGNAKRTFDDNVTLLKLNYIKRFKWIDENIDKL